MLVDVLTQVPIPISSERDYIAWLQSGRAMEMRNAADETRPPAPVPFWWNVPMELQGEYRWTTWRYTWRGSPWELQADGRWSTFGDWTKVPDCRSNDPTTWKSFGEVVRTYLATPALAGIGMNLGDGWGGFDLDNSISQTTGRLENWAWEIVDKFAPGSYIEISPSGHGVKGIFRAPPGPGRKMQLDAKHLARWGLRPLGDDQQRGIELYTTGRYFTVTGRPLQELEPSLEPRVGLTELPHALNWLALTYLPVPAPRPVASLSRGVVTFPIRDGFASLTLRQARAWHAIRKRRRATSGRNGHRATISVACSLIARGLSVEEAMPVLRLWNLDCHPTWGEAELLHKLRDADEFINRMRGLR